MCEAKHLHAVFGLCGAYYAINLPRGWSGTFTLQKCACHHTNGYVPLLAVAGIVCAPLFLLLHRKESLEARNDTCRLETFAAIFPVDTHLPHRCKTEGVHMTSVNLKLPYSHNGPESSHISNMV